MRRIGILGGGQLCLMLSDALHRLGASVQVFEPAAAAPARDRLARVTTREWADPSSLRAFLGACDRVTYEMEQVPSAPLRRSRYAQRLLPGLPVLEITQDRIREKEFLAASGLPLVAFASVPRLRDLPSTAERFGYPFVLKSAQGGYDGKGQYLVHSPAELANLLAGELSSSRAAAWVLEELVQIETELSCIVARSADGRCVTFPVFENLHRHHILDFTLVPARVPLATARQARALARATAEALGVVGLLTVELFLARSRRSRRHTPRLYINELAPRPHNSGHVTRIACSLSQFDALARVLLDVPLTEPELVGQGAYCMGNLLGEVWLAQGGRSDLDLSAWARHPGVREVYLYGKSAVQERRKMGHFLVQASTADAALRMARAFRRDLMGDRQGRGGRD